MSQERSDGEPGGEYEQIQDAELAKLLKKATNQHRSFQLLQCKIGQDEAQVRESFLRRRAVTDPCGTANPSIFGDA